MSWKDNLLTASFKGASFSVVSSSISVGRRNKLHTFINRDKPYWQDLGSSPEQFEIEGFVIQKNENDFDYFAARDALKRALQSKGAGILVHPYYGIKRVGLASPARIDETISEGGVARFSMTFVEAGDRIFTTRIPDWLSKIDNAVNVLNDKVGDFFLKVYQTTGAFISVTNNAIDKSISTIQTSLTGIQTIPTSIINTVVNNISRIRTTVSDVEDNATTVYNAIKNSCNSLLIACGLGKLIKQEQESLQGNPAEGEVITGEKTFDELTTTMLVPESVTGGETGSYSGITRGSVTVLEGDTVPNEIGKSLLRSITNTIDNFSTADYTSTPNSQQSNVVLIFNTVKLLLLSAACRIAVRTDFKSQEEIVEYREALMDIFEAFLLEVGSVSSGGGAEINIGAGTDQLATQDIFLAVEDLRDFFAESMTDKIEELPGVVDYTPPAAGGDCITLAYDKYGDIERYSEIYSRNENAIRHPGFLPVPESIRILEE